MANYKKIIPFILCYEGGYSNKPTDRGGETNKGITMATWRAYCAKKGKPANTHTLKAITQSEWEEIFKTNYWDKCKGDLIEDQSIASMLVDFAWHSGVTNAVKTLQRVLGVKVDGIIGKETLRVLNAKSPLPIFGALKQARLKFLNNIVKNDPKQKVNLKGWTNRVNAITYGKLAY